MKTLLKSMFLIAVICLAAGCDKQDDLYPENSSELQLKSADNSTVSFRFYPTEEEYYCPVICDGETVDFLIGDGESLITHARIHYKNGQMIWAIGTFKGTLQSEQTGEIYRISEQDKFRLNENGEFFDLTARTNAIGDMGTHLILSIAIATVDDSQNGIFTVKKAMCVPDSDKD